MSKHLSPDAISDNTVLWEILVLLELKNALLCALSEDPID